MLVVALVLALVAVAMALSSQQAEARDCVRVLLVASDVLEQVGGFGVLASLLIDPRRVCVVPYDYNAIGSYAELGGLVRACNGHKRTVRSIGIMYHTGNRYNLQCFASDPPKSTVPGDLSSLDAFEPFRRFVVAMRAEYGVDDIDLISCDVVSGTNGVLGALDFGGARVNASTNTTGQVKSGPIGDWVLEVGNVRLIGRYFKADIANIDLGLSAKQQAASRTARAAKDVTIYFQIAFPELLPIRPIVFSQKLVRNWPTTAVSQVTLINFLKRTPEYARWILAINNLRVPKRGQRLGEITELGHRLGNEISLHPGGYANVSDRSIYRFMYFPVADQIGIRKINLDGRSATRLNTEHEDANKLRDDTGKLITAETLNDYYGSKFTVTELNGVVVHTLAPFNAALLSPNIDTSKDRRIEPLTPAQLEFLKYSVGQ
jgi:hypothetical protein